MDKNECQICVLVEQFSIFNRCMFLDIYLCYDLVRSDILLAWEFSPLWLCKEMLNENIALSSSPMPFSYNAEMFVKTMMYKP